MENRDSLGRNVDLVVTIFPQKNHYPNNVSWNGPPGKEREEVKGLRSRYSLYDVRYSLSACTGHSSILSASYLQSVLMMLSLLSFQ